MRKVSILLLWLCALPALADYTPKTKTVELKEITTLVVDVMPDLAVQFIFPFILDSPKLKPAFKPTLTNTNIFAFGGGNSAENVKAEISGQNTVTVTVIKPTGTGDGKKGGGQVYVDKTYLGTLLMTVDGFNVSITLRTNVDPQKHYTNIVFTLSKEKRKYLVEKEVEYIRKAQNEAYQQKMDALNIVAQKKAIAYIGEVAINKLDTFNIKYDHAVTLDTHEEMIVFIDKILDYQKYIMVKFYLENKSNNNVMIEDAKLMRFDNDNAIAVDGTLLCEGFIRPGDDKVCVVTTQDRSVIDAKKLSLNFVSNHGAFSVQW